MKTKSFHFDLPEELIAQHPAKERDRSRMMVVDRSTGMIDHRYFYEIDRFLTTGDVIAVNNSKVIPVRLVGRKETGAVIEILLLTEEGSPCIWTALLRPGKRVSEGTQIVFDDTAYAIASKRLSPKKWLLEFHTEEPFFDFLDRVGKAPLPPYIRRENHDGHRASDIERYQTVYAKAPGSVAAPTAGLHFSEEVLTTIRYMEIPVVPVTLHVGYGTFLPVETEDVENHLMEEERFTISAETARMINAARRVVAVGTTTVRCLESAAGGGKIITPHEGRTDLFLYPGKTFSLVDVMVTNFHLPRSSLFLLVCAFAGTDLMKKAYDEAIRERYRFYSYGDCMMIL